MTLDIGGYRGSTLLKKPGQKIEWTQEQLYEYMRCAEDPIYFAQTYMKIVSKDAGLISFALYDYQIEIIETICRERFTVVECARQAGKTSALTAFILHYLLFNEHKVVAIVANKGETARKILSSIQFAYERLPLWLQQGIVEWNKGSMVLENGSKIVASNTTADNLRGWAIDVLFVDEAAHIDGWEEFWTSIKPTISSGRSTKVVLVSTVNGMNHFHAITSGARETDPAKYNGWKLISVKWDQVPGRDEEWKETELKSTNYNYDLFAQEYCVHGDTEIAIRDRDTGTVCIISIEKAFELLNEENDDIILRKNSRFEILTPDGWSSFDGISRTIRNDLCRLFIENASLKCTSNHRLLMADGTFKEARHLQEGDYVLTKYGHSRLLRIELLSSQEYVFDAFEVEKGHSFYTNDFISHNCNEYLGSAGTLIAGWKLKELIGQPIINPIFNDFDIFMYQEPRQDRRYFMVCDVSEGKGLDYSAFQLIDVTEMPYQQVCAYKSNQTLPADFAEIINRVGRHYNDAQVLVEINSIGQQVSEILFHDFEYENLVHTENKGRLGKRLLGAFGVAEKSERGIRTTGPVKKIGCSLLKILVEQNQLVINDYNTIAELTWFIKDKNTYNAEKGKNDDLVICLVLFAWISDQPYFKESIEISTLLKIREQSSQVYQDAGRPLAYRIDGVTDTIPAGEVRGGDYWMTDPPEGKRW